MDQRCSRSSPMQKRHRPHQRPRQLPPRTQGRACRSGRQPFVARDAWCVTFMFFFCSNSWHLSRQFKNGTIREHSSARPTASARSAATQLQNWHEARQSAGAQATLTANTPVPALSDAVPRVIMTGRRLGMLRADAGQHLVQPLCRQLPASVLIASMIKRITAA
jgi:hypothetical protein